MTVDPSIMIYYSRPGPLLIAFFVLGDSWTFNSIELCIASHQYLNALSLFLCFRVQTSNFVAYLLHVYLCRRQIRQKGVKREYSYW
jgi:hypothetical protein